MLTAIDTADNITGKSEFEMLQQLSELSSWPVPMALEALEKEPVRHEMVCEKEEMAFIIKKIVAL